MGRDDDATDHLSRDPVSLHEKGNVFAQLIQCAASAVVAALNLDANDVIERIASKDIDASPRSVGVVEHVLGFEMHKPRLNEFHPLG